jgi:uncharacterized protein (DUF983 family)
MAKAVGKLGIPRWVSVLIAIPCALIVTAIACIILVGGSQCGFRYGLTVIFDVLPLFVVFFIGIIPVAAVLNMWLMRVASPARAVAAWLGLVICATIALVVYANMPFPNAPAVFTGVQGQLCSLPDF